MKAERRINVEVLRKKFIPPIDAVQYDTGLQIILVVRDLNIPDGTTTKAFFKKPSGKFVYQDCTISGNEIVIDVHNQALTEYGNVYYQVKLTNGSDTITTFTGKIDVEKSLADSSATSSETVVPAFDAAVQAAVAEIEKAMEEAISYIGNGLDSSLSVEGKAADAGATGMAIDELKSDIDDVSIQVISTNLYNEELVIDGKVLLANGNLSDLSNFITIDNLSVESGRTLFFSTNPNQGYTERNATEVFRMFFKGSDGSLLDTAIEGVTSIEVPSNASMLIASFAKSSLQNGGFAINYDEIKPYEPYYSKRVPVDRERVENNEKNIVILTDRVDDIDRIIDDNFVLSRPVNLYNPDDVTVGIVKYDGTIDTSNTSFSTTNFIEVEAGKTLYFSRQDYGDTYRTAVSCYLCFYDSNKERTVFVTGSVKSYTIPDGSYYVRISVNYTSSTDGKDFAINFDEIKPYEPYRDPIIISSEHDMVISHDKYIDSYVKTSRDTDYTRIVKSCTHVKRVPLVTIIADDGWANDYIKLMDMVDKVHETYPDANIPCCISLQTNAVHMPNGMTLEQAIYSQNELGWEYCCHVDGTNLANLATEEEIEEKIIASLKLYDEYGIDAKNIVYCEGGNDERVRRISKKYFNCGATTLPWYGGTDTTSDNTGVIGSFYLKRHGMGIYPSGDGTFENDYKVAVDNAIAHNGWLIFMLHPNASAHDETQQGYFIETVKYCIEQNVSIVTLQQGYEIFGNALECGDFLGSTSEHPDQGFAISKNGDFSKNPFA